MDEFSLGKHLLVQLSGQIQFYNCAAIGSLFWPWPFYNDPSIAALVNKLVTIQLMKLMTQSAFLCT